MRAIQPHGAGIAQMSNSPALTPPRNARHSDGVNTSTGPAGSLLSRSATTSGKLSATSTHCPWASLRMLLCHWARDRSTAVAFLPLRQILGECRDQVSCSACAERGALQVGVSQRNPSHVVLAFEIHVASR